MQLDQLDREKLQIYYSNFIISKETKARHAHKLEFWYSTIKDFTAQRLLGQSQFIFDSLELEAKFTRNNLRPLCFNNILMQWKQEKVIVSEKEFLPNGTFERIKTVIKWISDLFQEETLVEREKFIFMPLLEESINKYYNTLSLDVMEQKDIVEQFPELTTKDLEILIQFWKSKGILCVKNVDSLLVVKKKKSCKTEINIVDEGVVKVRATQRNLKQGMKEIEEKIQNIKQEIHVNLKNKEKAKEGLKRLKIQQELLDTRSRNFDNLQGILDKINQVGLDKKVIEAMEIGSSSLEQVLKESGLTREYIEDVFLKVEEVADSLQEIEDAFVHDDNIDMHEIEQELDELILKESMPQHVSPDTDIQEEQESLKMVEDAPAVPDGSLSMSKKILVYET